MTNSQLSNKRSIIVILSASRMEALVDSVIGIMLMHAPCYTVVKLTFEIKILKPFFIYLRLGR